MTILDRTDEGAIARLTLNSPGNLNALSDAMLAALKSEFAGLSECAHRGLLHEAILAARTFGFHLATLDVRQHSRVHEAAVAEMREASVEVVQSVTRRLIGAEIDAAAAKKALESAEQEVR